MAWWQTAAESTVVPLSQYAALHGQEAVARAIRVLERDLYSASPSTQISRASLVETATVLRATRKSLLQVRDYRVGRSLAAMNPGGMAS